MSASEIEETPEPPPAPPARPSWEVPAPAAIFFGILSALLPGPGHHGLNGTTP